MRMRKASAVITAMAMLAVGGCSRFEPTMEDEGFTQPSPTMTRPDWQNPYGPGWEQLVGKPPEKVATAALEKLCSFTPAEHEEATAYRRLDGVVTPQLWKRMSDDPRAVVTGMPLRDWDQWARAGGGQRVTVAIDDEIHPPDTESRWQRKASCRRQLDGFPGVFVDGYVVGVSKTGGQWKLSDLQYMTTTYTNEATR